MNWHRIAKRLLCIIAKLRAENKTLRERVIYEQKEVARLAEYNSQKACAEKQQVDFWKNLKR